MVLCMRLDSLEDWWVIMDVGEQGDSFGTMKRQYQFLDTGIW